MGESRVEIIRILTGLMMLVNLSGSAQKISETQWFFGASVHNLQFDKNGDRPYPEERMNADFGTAGSTVISNQYNGNLLFYSDGVRVYDGSNQLIAGFVPLNGNPNINVPAVSCPVPNSLSEYFIFTNSRNTGVNEIQVSQLDASQAGNGTAISPLGTLVSANNQTGLANPAEGMIIIKHPVNAQAFWLVSQDRTNFNFRVSEVNATGIGITSEFALFSDSIPGGEAAHFSFNVDSALLAVAPKRSNRNVILLNFNDTTGVLTFNSRIRNTSFPANAGENVYDLEWSPDGSKLYLSRFGDTTGIRGNVYQIDLNDSLLAVSSVLQNRVFRSYGLRRGIDNRMYHMYQEIMGAPFQIGRFENLDSAATAVTYEPAFLDIDFNGRQFPNFAPNNFSGFTSFDMTYRDSCQNQTAKFFPLIDPMPNNFFWSFNGEGFSDAVAPLFAFENPGPKTIILAAEIDGYVDIRQFLIEIVANDLEIDLGADTVICINETLELDAGSDGLSFVWNTGELTQTIEIDSAGTFWVEVTATNGCRSFGSIEITEYGNQRQISNQWYFGEMAGIDFNQPTPVPITDANMMFSPEGCATISDAQGELLFYTNGNTVWNKNHNIMSNGTGLAGDSAATQGVLIMPFSDEITMFYIFTVNQVTGNNSSFLTYSIVDIKKDMAQGSIIAKNLPFFTNSTEKITASGFNANAWLVTHESGNNSFRANQITDEGIGATFFTPLGEQINSQNPEKAKGHMKFSAGSILFGHTIPNLNFVELMDFNFNQGRFSNVRTIDAEETENLYGLEFGGTSRLYVTTQSKLIQYDLDSLNSPTAAAEIQATKFDGYPTGTSYGALQTGPDGIIYLAIDNAGILGTISAPTGDDAGIGLNTSGFDLSGRTSRLGLPNFVQNSSDPPQPPGFGFLEACFGRETQFIGQGTSDIDEFYWTFDNGPRSTSGFISDTVRLYDNPGRYIVQLDIRNRCVPPDSFFATFIDTVDVFLIPETPLVPDEANLCNGPLLLEAWDVDRDDLIYYWSTGDSTRTINVTSAGSIDVAIINAEGCSSDTLNVFVGDSRPFLDLGNDRFFCQNDGEAEIDGNASGVRFQWFVEGILADTIRIQRVNTREIGEYIYNLEIIEPFFGCRQQDTLLVTIQPQPDVGTDFVLPSNCGATDGSITFNIANEGFFAYQVIGDGTLLSGTTDGPVTLPAITNVGGGNFLVSVENTLTGCLAERPVFLEDNAPYDLFANNLPFCREDLNLQITLSGLNVPDFADLYIINDIGDTVFSSLSARVPFRIAPFLEEGLYLVNVYDEINNCLQADSVLIATYLPGETDCLPTIIAPSAFSPNGNAQNEEFFVIPNSFVDRFEIFIYSRWGEVVFYSDNQFFRWDGTQKGVLLQPGTFAYVIKFTSLEDPGLGELSQFGSITLIR